jgi:hypothetical protein
MARRDGGRREAYNWTLVSAYMLVKVPSPVYFNSEYCLMSRTGFANAEMGEFMVLPG